VRGSDLVLSRCAVLGDVITGRLEDGTSLGTGLPFSGDGVLLFNGAPALSSMNVWRISVKFIRDALGNLPDTGAINTEQEVCAQITGANTALCAANSEYFLELTEILDVENVRDSSGGQTSRWSTMACYGDPGRDKYALEVAAKADPDTYHWRESAINVYIVGSLSGCGAICSLPGEDIIVMGQQIGPRTLLHEIGHYFGLYHTHGSSCRDPACDTGPSCEAAPARCDTGSNDDGLSDTLRDFPCWTEFDICWDSFGTYYSEDAEDVMCQPPSTEEQRAQVDRVYFNVMSYHHPERPERRVLTPQQIEHMASVALLQRSQVIGFVARSPCDSVTADHVDATGNFFLRGDANSDGVTDISDPLATLGVLFLGQGNISCKDAMDANDDGAVDISDAVTTLGFLFLGTDSLPAPGIRRCGPDPSRDNLPQCGYDLEGCPSLQDE
jgi:hypothetical protein